MKLPMISVIVPVYNTEKFLKESIGSIQKQSYRNWECILVDDGSKDMSGKICDKFAEEDARIRVIHKSNGGVSSARNAGMDAAYGDYFMFLDSDDELTVDCMNTLMAVANEKHAEVVSAQMCGDSMAWQENEDVVIWENEEPLKKSLMDNPYTYSACAKLFQRECVEDIRFRSDIRVNEDSLFVFEVLCRKPTFVGLKKAVYQYNYNSESASRAAFSEKYFDILHVAKIKYKMIQEQFPHLIKYAMNMQLKAQMNMLYNLAGCPEERYNILEKELISKVKENSKYFIPEVEADKKWLFIIDHNLYFMYKRLRQWNRFRAR